VSIVRRQDKSDNWQQIKFVMFDAPGIGGPFEVRQKALAELLRQHRPPYAAVLSQVRCAGIDALQAELARVQSLGGEGLMLRQPGSLYVSGRSPTLLKVKTFHDAEGKVVEHLPGKGRHQGRLGAVVVELPNGLTFAVGSGFSDAERQSPPPVGSAITYRYQEMTDRGVPRFPSFVRMRTDVAQPPPAVSRPTRSKQVQQRKGQNMKRYFEFVEGSSSKFWEISQNGSDVTVRFGRIGTDGQSDSKALADAAAAARHAEKLIKEKTGKGYQETAAT
jgi:DNA ligase-1